MANNKIMSEKKLIIEDEYQQLSELERVLLRPGTYLGNIHYTPTDINLYKPSENKMILIEDVNYNAGLLKLFDEIIQNSIDAFIKRNIKHDITRIEVVANEDGSIRVFDDGGVPVVKHKVTKKYVPHMIFGTLGTGGNYNQKIGRKGAGLNGLGAKLANIYSTQFTVETCDGSNKFIGEWSRNMCEYKETVVKSKNHYTDINYKIELSRFDITKLDLSTLRIIQKRCIDAAACNPGLNVKFTSDCRDGVLNSEWEFESFEEYVKMFVTPDDLKTMISYKQGEHEFCIIPRNIGYDFWFCKWCCL